ncbi:bifunctional phosphopantothenoylcysteine decarboxylase/phosphopantothenate--cysteine ligase CoaBC [Fructobacillus ficulneus]|uniref:Coenzyme A biosynthesis bifunctional protein CoaBC n=1 Tax=Fructobacillus ficulneus TaxID=157463 RepID=A0A0K8MIU0_9LACO|nr:bifunctional phosphopantothenoylcysteine decarboxylase/phosphopantothenate--cysteine ligase CoaBC [Fructobacillus ficulneus]GAP00467.1 phosphopantothenoylcysteine decarboxylase/phosphopantothenate--cysteine ligase [Fructobacillus ficulneus]
MTDFYQNKNVLLAVTGGIAAYKMTELTRSLIKAGATVKVVMTDASQEFIPAKTLAILSKNEVLTDVRWHSDSATVDHVALGRWADLVLVAPLTANTLAKLALGQADNVMTTTVMASPAPKFAAPAMNDGMWRNPAVQRNVDLLVNDGWTMVGPDTGFLAEGYQAQGRMVEPADILTMIEQELNQSQTQEPALLAGQHVVVTAGGTEEPIDPVRYLTNRSSGKMGYALAEAARLAGAEVTLVAAKTLPVNPAINVVTATSAREMLTAVQEAMPSANVFIGAAAVSDYRVAQVAENKVKKHGDDHLVLDLVQNPDILKTVGQNKEPGQVVVGFAAETQNLVENAQKKLISKNADLIVANNVLEAQAGFNKDTNKVTLVSKDNEPRSLAAKLKTDLATDIVAEIARIQSASNFVV